jgi:hypothetical protein
MPIGSIAAKVLGETCRCTDSYKMCYLLPGIKQAAKDIHSRFLVDFVKKRQPDNQAWEP